MTQTGMLSVPFPDWLRWVGFAGGLASLALWTWTQAVLGKEWSPQRTERFFPRWDAGG